MRLALLVVMAGCWQSRPSPSPGTTRPACNATLDPLGFIRVAGRKTGVSVPARMHPDADPPTWDGAAVRVWSRDASSIYMAWTQTGKLGRPIGSDTLYEVDCTTAKATPKLTRKTADFGHAAISGERIYFTERDHGVRVTALAGGEVAQVSPDSTQGQGDERCRHTDVVQRLDGGGIVFERGGPCWFDGLWIGVPHRMELGRPTTLRRLAPVAGLGVVDNTLWVAMGSCTGAVPSLWQLRERGARWSRIAIPEATGEITSLAASGREVATIVEPCGDDAITSRARLYVRDVHGAWFSSHLPPERSIGDGERLAFVGGQLMLAYQENGSTPVVARFGPRQVSEGPWFPGTGTVPLSPRVITLDGVTYRATDDGLLVETGAGSTRVFPH